MIIHSCSYEDESKVKGEWINVKYKPIQGNNKKGVKNMNIGDKIYVNDSIGDAIILDIKKEYMILFRLGRGQFIKANGYEIRYGKLVWNSGEYYNSLNELIESIKR